MTNPASAPTSPRPPGTQPPLHSCCQELQRILQQEKNNCHCNPKPYCPNQQAGSQQRTAGAPQREAGTPGSGNDNYNEKNYNKNPVTIDKNWPKDKIIAIVTLPDSDGLPAGTEFRVALKNYYNGALTINEKGEVTIRDFEEFQKQAKLNDGIFHIVADAAYGVKKADGNYDVVSRVYTTIPLYFKSEDTAGQEGTEKSFYQNPVTISSEWPKDKIITTVNLPAPDASRTGAEFRVSLRNDYNGALTINEKGEVTIRDFEEFQKQAKLNDGIFHIVADAAYGVPVPGGNGNYNVVSRVYTTIPLIYIPVRSYSASQGAAAGSPTIITTNTAGRVVGNFADFPGKAAGTTYTYEQTSLQNYFVTNPNTGVVTIKAGADFTGLNRDEITLSVNIKNPSGTVIKTETLKFDVSALRTPPAPQAGAAGSPTIITTNTAGRVVGNFADFPGKAAGTTYTYEQTSLQNYFVTNSNTGVVTIKAGADFTGLNRDEITLSVNIKNPSGTVIKTETLKFDVSALRTPPAPQAGAAGSPTIITANTAGRVVGNFADFPGKAPGTTYTYEQTSLQNYFVTNPNTGVVTIKAGADFTGLNRDEITLSVNIKNPSGTVIKTETLKFDVSALRTPPAPQAGTAGSPTIITANTAGRVVGNFADFPGKAPGTTYTYEQTSLQNHFVTNPNTGVVTIKSGADFTGLNRDEITLSVNIKNPSGTVIKTETLKFDVSALRTPPAPQAGAAGSPTIITTNTAGRVVGNFADFPGKAPGTTYTYEQTSLQNYFVTNPNTGVVTIKAGADFTGLNRDEITLSVNIKNSSGAVIKTETLKFDVSALRTPPAPQAGAAGSPTIITTNTAGRVVGTFADFPGKAPGTTYTYEQTSLQNHFVTNPNTGVVTIKAGADFTGLNRDEITLSVNIKNSSGAVIKTETLKFDVSALRTPPAPQAGAPGSPAASQIPEGTIIISPGYSPGDEIADLSHFEGKVQTRTYRYIQKNQQDRFTVDRVTGKVTIKSGATPPVSFESLNNELLELKVDIVEVTVLEKPAAAGQPATPEQTLLVKTRSININIADAEKPVAPIKINGAYKNGQEILGSIDFPGKDGSKKYRYTQMTHKNHFSVDPNTGKITIKSDGVIDFKTLAKDIADLKVKVEEITSGEGEDAQTRIVTLKNIKIDVADVRIPTSNMEVTISRNPRNLKIFSMKNDSDLVKFPGTIIYEIVNKGDNPRNYPFKVHGAGPSFELELARRGALAGKRVPFVEEVEVIARKVTTGRNGMTTTIKRFRIKVTVTD